MFPKTKDAQSFPPLPAGWYKLKVVEVKEKKDKNGDPFWSVEFDIPNNGRKVWDTFRNNEEWLWQLKIFLECIDPALTETGLDVEGIYGQEVMGYLVPGGDFSQVKQYKAVGLVEEIDTGSDFP